MLPRDLRVVTAERALGDGRVVIEAHWVAVSRRRALWLLLTGQASLRRTPAGPYLLQEAPR
jgi:hypothetical protein